jgi:glycosyltransferase involved in cell wall biosynthesis
MAMSRNGRVSDGTPSVVYVLPDKMGGMTNIVANLLAYRQEDDFSYHTVLTDNRHDRDARTTEQFAADSQQVMRHRLPKENLYAVLRRLRKALPPGPGVLVANDLLELAMVAAYDLDRTVVQILHGDFDYYYDLADRHQNVVDAFVVYSRAMLEKLRQRLPRRHDSIFYLPYGVPIPDRARRHQRGPLHVLFAGRFENGQKGVLDLPKIDRLLRQDGVEAVWTLIGAGPDEARLREEWRDGRTVRWLGHHTNADVRAMLLDHDVFVLPTRAEGLPVALLEAAAAGVVPVVSHLPGGIPEIVAPGTTGYCPEVGDVRGFADAIARLARDRDQLESCSRAVRALVAERFDIRACAARYQDLYGRWRELRRLRPSRVAMPYGSRLDRPWLPNFVTRAARAVS